MIRHHVICRWMRCPYLPPHHRQYTQFSLLPTVFTRMRVCVFAEVSGSTYSGLPFSPSLPWLFSLLPSVDRPSPPIAVTPRHRSQPATIARGPVSSLMLLINIETRQSHDPPPETYVHALDVCLDVFLLFCTLVSSPTPPPPPYGTLQSC